MTASPIRSLAQHRMLTRAVTDGAYATERGITASAAQQLLDAHKAAGEPQLPERAGSPKPPPQGKPANGARRRKYNLIGAA